MKVYTYSEARQSFAALLEEACRRGSIRIRRKTARVFVLRPEVVRGSPLDVKGINLALTRDEIIAAVHRGAATGSRGRMAQPHPLPSGNAPSREAGPPASWRAKA